MSRRSLHRALAAAFLASWTTLAIPLTAAPKGAETYIIWPGDGAVIDGGRLWVRMGLKGMGICPKGIERPNCGHHHLLIDAELPPRVRTIAILRTCALVGCAYEWGGQAAFWGPIAGVSDAECDALVTGADAGWSADEQTLIDDLRRPAPRH
mgnify:CR=1 FL=1